MNPLNHVAIIMDGNGRWGLKNKNSRNLGHKEGLKVIEKIILISIKYKIRNLTLFAFSTENWKRPKHEIDYLFNLFGNFLSKKIEYLDKHKIRLKIIGKKLPNKKLAILINKAKILTKKNKKLNINLALNYGSKDEIVNSMKIINKKKLPINKKNISDNLYTSKVPDPDILIRTGGKNRLSNFLLWQISYTEIFFEKKLWPEFKEKDFIRIINKYRKIKRNYGSIKCH